MHGPHAPWCAVPSWTPPHPSPPIPQSLHPLPPKQAHSLDDTTYVYDLGNTVRLYRSWCAALPRVAPFYAVKCNPEPGLLRLLAALGAGFDCASKAEIEAVLALGVARDRVIFAHPCKRPADLRFARDAGIGLTTFDSEGELAKVAAHHPGVGLVMRVRCDDPEVRAGGALRAVGPLRAAVAHLFCRAQPRVGRGAAAAVPPAWVLPGDGAREAVRRAL